MKKIEFDLYGDGRIKGIKWIPDEVESCLLICHGITEYIDRYDTIACKLADNGIAVFGFDMRGHGDSTDQGIQLDTMLKDIDRLIDIVKQESREKPVQLLGFSYGSFLIRVWLNRQEFIPDNIDDIILIGTGSQSNLEIMMAKLCAKESNLDDLTFGTYNKRFKPAETRADWLCANKEELNKYLIDNKVRPGFTLELFKILLNCMSELNKEIRPQNVRIHFLSGEEDPVGGFGKGVRRLADRYKKAGYEITCRIYKDARHDLLREKCRNQVIGRIEDICRKE